MRLSWVFACLLVTVGCVGPHSTGALWAQQSLEQELVIGRQTEAERMAQMHAYELTLADEALAAERTRLSTAVQDCPGSSPRTMELSPGDRTRDAIRPRIGDDGPRQAAVAQLALADWRLRRAQATGAAHFCADARQALAAAASADAPATDTSVRGQPTATDALAGLGAATVTRDPRNSEVAADLAAREVALSNYALGYADTVRARTPLPQYLAAVYGGVLLDVDSPPSLNIWMPGPTENPFTAEAAVDLLAPLYPQWEPDALFLALQPTQ
jgi:hypothetical protein